MREIKFRAKRIDNGAWVYGRYFKTPLTEENSGTKPEAGWFFLTGEPRHCIESDYVAFVVDVKTLGEYTGLEDDNGKEIYEGDICLRSKIDASDIRWHEEDAQFFLMGWRGCSLCYMDLEVIGNIYENPELVK